MLSSTAACELPHITSPVQVNPLTVWQRAWYVTIACLQGTDIWPRHLHTACIRHFELVCSALLTPRASGGLLDSTAMAEQLVEELLQGRQVVGVVSPEERQRETDGQIQQQRACRALCSFHSLGSQQPPICACTDEITYHWQNPQTP